MTSGRPGPIVSVLLAAYNAEAFLAETLNSVLAQTHRPLEIIVVDDGSSDGTLALAQRYEVAHSETIRVITQANAGACAARNRAF
ncbi:MAG: glycosyltransferase family 2 protein, partial [Rubricoccaceae bacterium]